MFSPSVDDGLPIVPGITNQEQTNWLVIKFLVARYLNGHAFGNAFALSCATRAGGSIPGTRGLFDPGLQSPSEIV